MVFTGPTGTEDGLTDIQSIEVELQNEILSEGYLGETTNRRDDIFNGVRGRAEMHLENQAYMEFANRVTDRSQRRTPGVQFNMLASLNFPNGQRVRVLMEDISFGPLPLRVGGRAEYVQGTVEFESATFRFLF